MVKAGLGEDVVILAIRREEKTFDLSALELVQLKQAGVSYNVLKVMLDPKAEMNSVARQSEPGSYRLGSVSARPRRRDRRLHQEEG